MANIEQKFREACKQSGLASMLSQLNNPALNGLIGATLGVLKQSAGGNSITGVIKSIGQTTNVSKTGNAFNKRELVLDISRYDPQTGEKYESYVSLNFTQKHCDDLNGFAVGERVEVKFMLGGREWQGKIINDIVGFGIERVEGAQGGTHATVSAPQPPAAPVAPSAPQPAAQPAYSGQPAPSAAQAPQQQQNEDLPF